MKKILEGELALGEWNGSTLGAGCHTQQCRPHAYSCRTPLSPHPRRQGSCCLDVPCRSGETAGAATSSSSLRVLILGDPSPILRSQGQLLLANAWVGQGLFIHEFEGDHAPFNSRGVKLSSPFHLYIVALFLGFLKNIYYF